MVTVFEEQTPLSLIRRIRPDVLVKGADYRLEEVVGGDFVTSLGGRVHLAPLEPGMSTTIALEKVKAFEKIHLSGGGGNEPRAGAA